MGEYSSQSLALGGDIYNGFARVGHAFFSFELRSSFLRILLVSLTYSKIAIIWFKWRQTTDHGKAKTLDPTISQC